MNTVICIKLSKYSYSFLQTYMIVNCWPALLIIKNRIKNEYEYNQKYQNSFLKILHTKLFY